ncbi:TPA: VanZ family protein [Neisseria subflava]
MKALPLNKFTAAAFIWFAAAIYALLFKEDGNSAPPFPHFDKVGHFGLFFGQAWLCAKMFIQDSRNIPYKGILLAALLFAIGSELAQAFLTTTRQGSIADGIADMAGTAVALWFAEKVKAAKS